MAQAQKFIGYLTAAGKNSWNYSREIDLDGAGTVPYPASYVGSPLHCAVLLGDKNQVQQVIKDYGSCTAEIGRCGKSTVSVAVLARDEEILELLLKNGCSPLAPDADGRTPLHHAAQKAADGCARLLLSWCEASGSTTPARAALTLDRRSVTPLHVATTTAASTKCLALFLKHLEAGMLDLQDDDKRTPLHWAARYRNETAVALLLRHGANCLMSDDRRQTPLHCALLPPLSLAARSDVGEGRRGGGVREGADVPGVWGGAGEAAQLACVARLVEVSPDIISWRDSNGLTAVHVAACGGSVQCVQLLLKHKAGRTCTNTLDNCFRTPLHWAAISNKSSTVRCLLAVGAEMACVDRQGGTALHYAAALRHCDCVRVLSQQPGATEQLQGAVEWAAAAQADECIRVMVEHGAQLVALNHRGERYCPSLVRAAQWGHVGTVALLLSLCSAVNGADHTGVTALHAAALGGHLPCAKYLLRHGAELQRRDGRGRHVLHYAARGGHSRAVALLVRAGTDVNVQDAHGLTCLHVAAMRGYLCLVNLLLENAADVNLCDLQGASTLHYAARGGDVAVVCTLLEAGAAHSDLAHFHMSDGSVRSMTPLDLALETKQGAVAEVLRTAGAVTAQDLREVASCVIQEAWRRYHRRKYVNVFQNIAVGDGRPSASLAVSDGAELTPATCEKPSASPTVRPVSLTARSADAVVRPSRSLPLTQTKKKEPRSLEVAERLHTLEAPAMSSGAVCRPLSEGEHQRKIEEFRLWKRGLRVKEVRRCPDGNFSYNLCRPAPASHPATSGSCASNAGRNTGDVPSDRNKNLNKNKGSQVTLSDKLSRNQWRS